MLFDIGNDADRPVGVVFRPGDATVTLPGRGDRLTVEWYGSGPAELGCEPDALILGTPAGGHARAWDAEGVPLPVGEWPADLAAYPEAPRTDLLIVNRTGAVHTTIWEPVGQHWPLPPQAGPVRVEWVGPPGHTNCLVEWAPDCLVLHDGSPGSFRGWDPDGTEIDTLAFLGGLPPELARYGSPPTPWHVPGCGCPGHTEAAAGTDADPLGARHHDGRV